MKMHNYFHRSKWCIQDMTDFGRIAKKFEVFMLKKLKLTGIHVTPTRGVAITLRMCTTYHTYLLCLRIVVEWASPGDVIGEMEGFSGLIYG